MSDRNLRQVDILEMVKPFCKEYDVKMNKSDISQYVSGKVEPGQDKLAVLGMALNVNETWLMGYDVPMEKIPSFKDIPTAESLKSLSDYINLHPESIGYLSILCKNERIEKEYTEKSIAQQCNIPLKQYLDFENHYKNIGVDKINSILSVYNFNLSFILGYLAGATGTRDEIIDMMVSQTSTKNRDTIKNLASQMMEMDSEELEYVSKILNEIRPEDQLVSQKFTKAMDDFYKIKTEDET